MHYEDILIKHPDFQQLSGQKELIKEHFKNKIFIIDVTETPIQCPKKVKSSIKKKLLTKKQKQSNKLISKIKIVIENVFAKLKKFKIIDEKYRNRRKRFALKFNLIASIYNLELT